MSIEKFDQFLETVGPGRGFRVKQLTLSAKQLDQLREVYGVAIAMNTLESVILSLLGTPDASCDKDRSVSYVLPSNPGYDFKLYFNDHCGLIQAKYVRRGPGPALSPGVLSKKEIEKLKRIGATEDELLHWYGKPDDIVGWWPVETWLYGKISIEVRLGIVA